MSENFLKFFFYEFPYFPNLWWATVIIVRGFGLTSLVRNAL